MIDASHELNKLLDRSSYLFEDALTNLAKSRLGLGDYDKAFWELANLIQKTMILADLHGRKRILMEADAIARHAAKFSTTLPPSTPIVPGVPFVEAIEDLVSREPRLEQSSRELSRLYNTERVFGLAYSSDLALTKKIQDVISRTMKEGEGLAQAEKVIAEMGDWTRSYAAVVFRTNANTSYTQGRFAQAMDTDVAKVIPAMEFFSQRDDRTRPNHRAAHGLIAATNSPRVANGKSSPLHSPSRWA